MSNLKPLHITANTLGAVATMYGVDLRTLLGWIDEHKILMEKIIPYRDGKKRVYPPMIIKEIVDTLGEP